MVNLATGFHLLRKGGSNPRMQIAELKSRLKKKIRNPEIVAFIESAIKTPTVIKSDKNDLESKIGIPQGLSISNILAEIYLINLDRTLSSLPKETLNNV